QKQVAEGQADRGSEDHRRDGPEVERLLPAAPLSVRMTRHRHNLPPLPVRSGAAARIRLSCSKPCATAAAGFHAGRSTRPVSGGYTAAVVPYGSGVRGDQRSVATETSPVRRRTLIPTSVPRRSQSTSSRAPATSRFASRNQS